MSKKLTTKARVAGNMATAVAIFASAFCFSAQATTQQDNIPSAFECDGIQNNPNKFLFKETERPVKGALLILEKALGSAKFETWYMGQYHVDETSIGAATNRINMWVSFLLVE